MAFTGESPESALYQDLARPAQPARKRPGEKHGVSCACGMAVVTGDNAGAERHGRDMCVRPERAK